MVFRTLEKYIDDLESQNIVLFISLARLFN